MPDHDVAIVGGGPVGLLLACLLAQQGIDVVVYEQRREGDDRSRAIGIHPPGRAALDAVGVGEQARREALGLDGGDVLCNGRVLAAVDFTAHQRVLILPQHRTHALLVERLAQVRRDVVHRGHLVREVRDEGERVRLVVEADGVKREASASVVVAADGVHSGIRRSLGIAWRERRGSGSYAMADVADDGNDRRASLYCEPGGIVESFPLPEGQRRWVVADPRERLHDGAAFAAEIAQRVGVRLENTAEITPAVFRAQQHRAARAGVGRVVLLGDALHETSPIGGQGMNLGWESARELAAAIESSLRGAAPDFRAYERHALRAAARAQRRSAFYMRMGHPANGVGLGARNTVIRALGSAPMRRRAADLITMRGL